MFEIGYAAIAYILAIGILVTFHELGHYSAAQFFNVKTECFSLGFGPTLWKRRLGKDQTEWRLSWIPLGGYVRFVDEGNGEVAACDLPRAFNRQVVWKRMVILAAGPVTNFILATIIYSFLFMWGREEYRAIIAQPPGHSLAAKVGLQAEDEIVAMDGNPVLSWQDFYWQLLRKARSDPTVKLQIKRSSSGTEESYSLDWANSVSSVSEEDHFTALGLRLYQPPGPFLVHKVETGSPAEKAGLLQGDYLISVDNEPIQSYQGLQDILSKLKNRQAKVEFYRDGAQQTVLTNPIRVVENAGTTREKSVWRLGIILSLDPAVAARYKTMVQFSPAVAINKGVLHTVQLIDLTTKTLGRLVVGDASWQQISGPLTIADYAGRSLAQGVLIFLGMVAMLSVSLGVMNLLPVPLLDGGHLLYHTVELIRGAPPSEKILLFWQRLGVGLLVFFMGLALYNDLLRYWLK